MAEQVDLLSAPINFAVVQLPERNFPGVVVQGDTLHSMLRQVERMKQLLAERDLQELSDEIEDIGEQLLGAQTHFERICMERGIKLPY
ncbi:hypothetical protein G8O24_16640 [Bradyrhizobium sp. INPA01-394B]|uniref:Uncharacterized protein n=1 Tax=Bradyrhizobium campsiandrae TaxID=1729892 RepID=A0ABR7U6M9_9BRAD|nr:hypothetical protein [Bradyrhizobium campsiandrae]MBC9878969.1 hypothetical protein [Bradyrhizobium campsiandrae]MBC9979684.1 hypothetical protein [Bradyrhizobium campsiandrae]